MRIEIKSLRHKHQKLYLETENTTIVRVTKVGNKTLEEVSFTVFDEEFSSLLKDAFQLYNKGYKND